MRLGQRTPLLHKAGLMLGLALAALLVGCGGSGTKYQEFIPKRIVVIGDEISYLGCTVVSGVCVGTDANDRFTVNNGDANVKATNTSADNSLKLARFTNNWVAQLAANYGLGLSDIVEAESSRSNRLGAKLSNITTQSASIPTYTAGDMLIIAGGTNDILDALNNPPGSVTVNATMAPYRSSFLSKFSGGTGSLSDNQINQILNAAQGYLDLAKSLTRNGQRNVFIPAVYDFSNSPDLSNFCTGAVCSDPTTVKQAIYLFDIAMKFDPNSELQSLPGQARVLFATGYSSDALYVNLPVTLGPVSDSNKSGAGYNLTASVCGTLSVTNCYWTGTYNTSSVTATNSGVTTTITYSPIRDTDADRTSTDSSLSATITGNFNQYNAAFKTNPPSGYLIGNFVYAKDFYLMPSALAQVGNIFYIFMRGYYGW